MACPQSVPSDGFLGWRVWPFINFLVVLSGVGYFGLELFKKWKANHS